MRAVALSISLRTDAEANREWKNVNSGIKENIKDMESFVKHLNDITTYSLVNIERQVKHLESRHAPVPLPEEHATFPITMLPRSKNENFYGRQEELSRIDQYLD